MNISVNGYWSVNSTKVVKRLQWASVTPLSGEGGVYTFTIIKAKFSWLRRMAWAVG